MVVLAVLTVGVLLVAMLSDRIGVKPLMWAGCALLIAVSLPAFMLMRFGGAYPVKFAGVLLIGLPMVFLSSLEPAILPALFPTNVRYGVFILSKYFNPRTKAGGTTSRDYRSALLHYNGLAIREAYGDWDRRPLTGASPRMIYVCRLRA